MAWNEKKKPKGNKVIYGIALLITFAVPGQFALGAAALEKPGGWVERAVFASAIEHREPVDQLAVVPNTELEIYFFSDLRQLQGREVTHRWEYDGQVVAEVTFKVGGPRWRVYSRKSLDPSQIGKWTVVVVDESGWPLRAAIFDYRAASGIDGESGRIGLPPEVDELEQYAPPEREVTPVTAE